jgi:hypothetical protein
LHEAPVMNVSATELIIKWELHDFKKWENLGIANNSGAFAPMYSIISKRARIKEECIG